MESRRGEVLRQKDFKLEDSNAVVESDGHIPSLWKGKGRLLKEESNKAIIVWLSDDENNEEERLSLLPIVVLDDNDDKTTESFRSF